MSCPPPCPPPISQVCGPRPKDPVCLVKPVMRGLHWAQTKRVIAQACLASATAGLCVYLFIGVPRKKAYKEYYANAEFEEWANEMARKGLFQAVPTASLKDYCKATK